MVTGRKIIKVYGRVSCRQCVNRLYGIHLLHTDCRYEMPYPAVCPGCREMKNIVTGFRLRGYLKSMFKRGKYT